MRKKMAVKKFLCQEFLAIIFSSIYFPRYMRLMQKALLIFICLGALGTAGFFSRSLMLKPKYELSICAIFRDEASYLKEWIEFHKLQGATHFFLYNNNSLDDYLKVLNPYINDNTVTLIEWNYSYKTVEKGDAIPWLSIQTGAYNDCLKKYGKLTKWLAVIDIDEFLFCPSGKTLPLFLKGYESYAGLCVNWLLFGTSNLPSLPSNSLMIESLTRCAPNDEPRNCEIKSIIQPKYAIRAKSAHEFKYKKGYFAINALGDRIKSLFSRRPSYDLIRINHYWTRTEDHFSKRKIASRNGRRAYEDEVYLRERSKTYNEAHDTAILQFAHPLKMKLFPKEEKSL